MYIFKLYNYQISKQCYTALIEQNAGQIHVYRGCFGDHLLVRNFPWSGKSKVQWLPDWGDSTCTTIRSEDLFFFFFLENTMIFGGKFGKHEMDLN